MLVAIGADAAVKNLCKVVIFNICTITVNVKTRVVIFFLICAARKVVCILKRSIKQNGHIFGKTDRSDISCVKTAFFCDYGRVNFTA